MIYIDQTGKKAYASDELAVGQTRYDEDTQTWVAGWLVFKDNDGDELTDYDYAPMGRYDSVEDVRLVEKLRVWAEYTEELPTFRYPSADEAAELRERIKGLVTR